MSATDDLPVLEDIGNLPRWAIVAYVFRCAHQVFPVYKEWSIRDQSEREIAQRVDWKQRCEIPPSGYWLSRDGLKNLEYVTQALLAIEEAAIGKNVSCGTLESCANGAAKTAGEARELRNGQTDNDHPAAAAASAVGLAAYTTADAVYGRGSVEANAEPVARRTLLAGATVESIWNNFSKVRDYADSKMHGDDNLRVLPVLLFS